MEAHDVILAKSDSGNGARTIFVLTVWAVAMLFLGFGCERNEHLSLFSTWFVVFAAYWYLAKNTQSSHLNLLLISAILIRLALVFAFPKLSDDIYRFIWDGRLLAQGINPFEYTPSQLMESNLISYTDKAIYPKLNSPEYFTVYPLVCQAVFFVCSKLATNDVFLNSVFIKLFLFFCEFATILMSLKLLRKIGLSQEKILWYALNPLIIIEICGNAHFEGAMVAFLALGLFFLLNNKKVWSALSLSLSVASKMLTAVFFPLLIFREFQHRKIHFSLLLILFCILLSLPIFLSFNIFNSLDLYFRKFEFNAGLYYAARWIGIKISGYNQIAIIGPTLSFISTLAILILSFHKAEKGNLLHAMFWIVLIYLLGATTVHPWYLSLLLFLGIFIGYKFPYIWSGLIFLTYINYSQNAFNENLWIVAIEYTIVFIMILVESNFITTIKRKWSKTN